MDMIQTDKLVFEYDKRDEDGNIIGKSRAIDEVDIDVKEGQFIAILGHNGSGKSTFAKHINALLVPTDGTMWVDGRDTKDPNELWNVRQSAGMVFQNPDNQIIGTVVEEDVGFGPENLGVPTDEIWKRVEDSLKSVGMISYRHHSPNKLSGGQKQRVAIAGVIAMEPKCIVLDEPTAMLDPMGRKEVLKTVQKLREQKKVTVILITHYMEEVVDADKIYVMDHSDMELFAQGAGNIASALFGGIPATGAIARTSANIKNGGRTPIAGMVRSITLVIVLVVLMPYAGLIPMPTIAAALNRAEEIITIS